jgi:hypothetical protein
MLSVSYPYCARGNTVPYPSLFDPIRRNHGFIDLRGRPEKVVDVPEAQTSAALASLLTSLADTASPLVSLGCDLGERVEAAAPEGQRQVAGGYVQVMFANYHDQTSDTLLTLSKSVETTLCETSHGHNWEAVFELQPVHLKFGTTIETFSIWLWFMAAGATNAQAQLSREIFLNAIECGLLRACAPLPTRTSSVKMPPRCEKVPTDVQA